MITSLLALTLLVPRKIVSIREIPAPPRERAKRVYPTHISNSGIVIGLLKPQSGTPTSVPQVWSPQGGAIKLTVPERAKRVILRGVNGKGDAVGSYEEGGRTKSFLWSAKEGFRDLPSAGWLTIAHAINDNGEIVALSQPDKRGPSKGLIVRSGASVELQPLEGYPESFAWAINADGTTAGISFGNQKKHDAPTIWDASGRPLPIPLVPNATWQQPRAINGKGEVVGELETGKSLLTSFLYSGGTTIRLPHDGMSVLALDLNDKSQVVGTAAAVPKLKDFAFLYENGKLVDLNRLLPPKSGWVLETASGINDRGEVCGDGKYLGRPAAFVLRLG